MATFCRVDICYVRYEKRLVYLWNTVQVSASVRERAVTDGQSFQVSLTKRLVLDSTAHYGVKNSQLLSLI